MGATLTEAGPDLHDLLALFDVNFSFGKSQPTGKVFPLPLPAVKKIGSPFSGCASSLGLNCLNGSPGTPSSAENAPAVAALKEIGQVVETTGQ